MKRPHKLRRRFILVMAVGVLLALGIGTALAVHDAGVFELDTRAGVDGDQEKPNDPIPAFVGDANTVNDAQAGEDWADIYNGTDTADASVFVEDTFANNPIDVAGAEAFVALRTPENSFFTGGGSKDTNGIQEGPWMYDTVNDVTPAKNDILNAFAAVYEDPDTGRPLIYFGLDTNSVNGASDAGFWFFRGQVGLNPLAPGSTTGTFSGEHMDGDIFVSVAYTEGGSVGDIEVYEWQGDDATGSLVLLDEGASCATAAANDEVCGVINKLLPDQTFGEDPVFDYANTLVANNPTDPNSYKYESAALVEFGLDIEAILGEEIGCFSTFLAESRSSHAPDAQLKDFAFGQFDFCDIEVTKTGDTLSKIGDPVDYVITITNTGQATLYKDSIVDSLLGDLTDGTNPLITSSDCGASLAPGASCTITATRTVEAGDDDPLPNTVTIDYNEFDDLSGVSFVREDDHEVNLFQPSITFDKTGDTLSKIGDPVDYVITLNNTSTEDTPDLECTITDALLGVNESVTLVSGGSHVVNVDGFVIPEDASDPFENTASVACSPVGFPNVLNASDGHSIELFQPSIDVDKTGPEFGKNWNGQADEITYEVTITNTSSADTPNMSLVSFTDSLVAGVVPPAACDDLGPGGSCTFTYNYTPTESEGQGATLENTATAVYSPDGFPNQIQGSDDHTVTLIHPDFTVSKECSAAEPVPQEGPATWDVTITNTGDADLVVTADDGIGTFNLAPGASQTFPVSDPGPFAGQETVSNTVTASWVLDAKYGLDNTDDTTASDDCRIGSKVEVEKTFFGTPDPTLDLVFELYTGPDGFDSGTLLASNTTLGDADGILEFGDINLDPLQTYTICERNLPAGWTATWEVNGVTVTPYDPNEDDVPPEDLGNRCVDFGAGTSIPLTAGGTLQFDVDNEFPQGDARTPGYWKNWNTCTGGNQEETAAKNGGSAEGFWLLDDLLPQTIGTLEITTCEVGVSILDARDLNSGKKSQNDAAYNLARSLLAAQLNVDAGAAHSADVDAAIADANQLLADIGFDGTGSYLGPKVKGADALLREAALIISGYLDGYNNNLALGPYPDPYPLP